MVLSLVTWADHPINDGTVYVSWLTGQSHSRSGRTVTVQAPGGWGRIPRVDHNSRTVTVNVTIRDTSSSLLTRQRELAQWFAEGTEGLLVVDEDGTRKVLDAVVTGQSALDGSSTVFTATLVAADPRWRGEHRIVGAANVTASGQSFTFTNPGSAVIDDPVITLRPYAQKAAANGYLYKREVIVVNRAARPLTNYAIDVTGGGWAHDTEVGAGRSQADGDDVRVLVDGVEVPRWFGEHADNNANSTLTKVWANFDLAPRLTATLLSNITTSSPGPAGDLEVRYGGTRGWEKTGGAILLGTEVITYAGVTTFNANGAEAFTGVRRAQRGTTIAAATAGDTLYNVQKRVQIVYGNTSATAPDSRPDVKPMLDLTSNTLSNTRLEWISFADSAYPGRSMSWRTRSRTFDDQYDKILAPTASPLTALTWEYQSGGAVSGKPVGNTYYIDLPTGTGSSGGNVATITRVLADTLGMWTYGIDDAGQEVVLEKYAGALTSASDNITAPTNPIYRFECWVFNQVVLRALPPGYTGNAGYSVLGVGTPTADGTQFAGAADAIDIVGAGAYINSATAGRLVTLSLCADNGSNVPVSGPTFSPDITTVVGSVFGQGSLATPVVIQPLAVWWVTAYVDGGANTYWLAMSIPSRRSRWAGTNYIERSHDLVLYGRPNALAATFTRLNENAVADDGDQVTVDGVTIHLSSTETPYVSLKAQESSYRFATATLYNQTTGQSMRISARVAMNAPLVVDIGAGTVTNDLDEDGTSAMIGVEFSDPDRKFTLPPGQSAIQFVDTGTVGVGVAVEALAAYES